MTRYVTAFALAAGLLLMQPPPAFAQSANTAALAAYQGPDRAQRLIDGARREGELTLYTSMQMESVAPLQRAFEEKYGVKLRIWRGSGKDIRNRALTEAQAGRANLDIVESDGFALETLQREGLLQEVRSPFLNDLIPQALRPHGQWVGTRVNITVAVYNTRLVNKDTLPKQYEDLLEPRFKGVLGIEADDYDWFGMLFSLLGEGRGLKIFGDVIARNGISVRKGHTLLTNLAAAGEVPLGLTVFMQNADVARKNGAPVDWFLIPPTVARPNGIAMAKRAPHSHAALLFYDFMLSEGQQIMLKREFVPTSRKIRSVLDWVTLNFVDPGIVLDNGEKWQRLFGEVVRGGRR
jgi:iron(III) transport system substrate-binding protein